MKEKIENPETSVCVTYYIKTMETYCISCKKNTANENSSARKNKQNRSILLSSCVTYVKKKLTFICNKDLSNSNKI